MEDSGEPSSVLSSLFELFNLSELDLGVPGDDDDDWLRRFMSSLEGFLGLGGGRSAPQEDQ